MSVELKKMREERKVVAASIEELRKKLDSPDWSAADDAEWDKVNEDFNVRSKRIEREEQAEEVRKSQLEVPEEIVNPVTRETTTPEMRHMAMNAWCRARADNFEPTEEVREAAAACNIKLESKSLSIPLDMRYERVRAEHRQFSTIANKGGVTIAEGFVANLEEARLAFGGMLAVSDVIRTETGADLPWPTENDTGQEGELVGEAADNTVDTATPFAAMVLHAYKFGSKIIKISSELMQDSAFDMTSVIGRMAGTRLARGQNNYATTGTGAGQPMGAVTIATTGVTAASGTEFTDDEVVNMLHSIDPSYRMNSSWMMHDNTTLALRKLKDGEGQYIWRAGLEPGEPDRLLGKPMTNNQHMDSSIASGDTVMLFGDFSLYKIREVASIRLVRADELYLANDQVGFVAWIRWDSNLLNAGTNPLKKMVTT